jgi:D-alanine-D-alanine ligase
MSGGAVLAALAGGRASMPTPLIRPRRDLHILKEEGYDRAFIALHGRGGEDGTVQGALELMQHPLHRQRRDGLRHRHGQVAHQAGVAGRPACPPRASRSSTRIPIGMPWSPTWACRSSSSRSHEGSSMGATKVTEAGQLKGRLGARREVRFAGAGRRVRHRPGAHRALPGGPGAAAGAHRRPRWQLRLPEQVFHRRHPVFLPERPAGSRQEKEIQAAIVRCAKVLGCRGWGRADLILRDDGSFTLLEINTAPGMTNHSLVPMSARVAGFVLRSPVPRDPSGARLG